MENSQSIRVIKSTTEPFEINSYMKVKDVAKYLQISERIARELINNGHIKSTKIGSKIIRVHKDDVDEYMVNNKVS